MSGTSIGPSERCDGSGGLTDADEEHLIVRRVEDAFERRAQANLLLVVDIALEDGQLKVHPIPTHGLEDALQLGVAIFTGAPTQPYPRMVLKTRCNRFGSLMS